MSRGPMAAVASAGFKSMPVEAPDAPGWLSADALTEWDRIVPELVKSEAVAKVDQAALAAYCQAYAELVACTRVLETEGRFITEPVQNAKGEVLGERIKPHPAVSAQRDAFGRVKAYLAEFGLSPAARVRLKFMKEGGQDALSALLSGHAEANPR